MLKNHSMSSTRAFLLDCFLQAAKLLTIAFSLDGQVPLKQFVMEWIISSISHQMHNMAAPERGVSLV
jgi:hypothetical protein